MSPIKLNTKDTAYSQLQRAHLVFENISQELIAEISKYCIITCIHERIEEVSKWVSDNRGYGPDLFLINCARHFSGLKKTSYSRAKAAFLNHLSEIKKAEPDSRLVLLIPEYFANDLNFLAALLKLRIFDLWFLDSFGEKDISEFITVSRTQEELENYIREKEEIQLINKNNGFLKNKLDKIYRPYYVKSNVMAFWSFDEPLLNHAVAVLTSLKLAANGFKVALIEGITPVPRLAWSMHLDHPYFNTRHALAMYAAQNTGFLKNCLFNSERYLDNPHSMEKDEFLAKYPRELYFLPDRMGRDGLFPSEHSSFWKDFVDSLTRIIIFEQNFNFLIYLCEGYNEYNKQILTELAYTKFLTISLHPASILLAQQESRKGNNLHIIGNLDLGAEVANPENYLTQPLVCAPSTIKKDFLGFVYKKDFLEITPETHKFIEVLTELIGVRLSPYEPRQKKWGVFRNLQRCWLGR